MTVTREQEIWALALWIDRENGEDAEDFTAGKVLHFVERDDEAGRKLWEEVARRFVQLRDAQTADLN